MENYIFYCYKEWRKRKKDCLHKQLSGLTVPAIVLLGLLLLTLIAMIVVFGMAINGTYHMLLAFILMSVEIVLAVISSIYAEKFQISHSKKNLAQYKDECKNLEEHLTECGLTNDYIPKLVDIYKERINRIEEKIKHKHETIHRFMEILLIPISAAILGAVLEKGSTVVAALGLGLSSLLALCLVYFLLFFVMYCSDFIMRIPENEYNQFVADLQSILYFGECKSNNISIDSSSAVPQALPESTIIDLLDES